MTNFLKEKYWGYCRRFHNSRLKLKLQRIGWRLRSRFAPWLIATAGTDCDGMRWENYSRCWTKGEALRDLHSQSDGADGPMGGKVYFPWTKSARRIEKGMGWADGRDRYAEDAGY